MMGPLPVTAFGEVEVKIFGNIKDNSQEAGLHWMVVEGRVGPVSKE